MGPHGTIAAAVRRGERSARDVLEEHLAVIAAREAELHACNVVLADEARAAADAVDATVARGEDPGPLAGVPIALKDNLCTRGIPTTCSSRILDGWQPPYTATVGRAPGAGRRASRSPRRTSTSSRWARRPRTRRSARRATRATRRASRVVRAGARRRRSPPGSRRSRSAPTPAVRSASPRRCAASSGSSRRTGACRATGSSRSRARSTRSDRSRTTSPTPRSCST